MSRSIKVAPEYILKVKLAVKRHGFPSYSALAMELGIAKSTLNNYLNGKPVLFLNFLEISRKLGLDWQEIITLPKDVVPKPIEQNQDKSIGINTLVEELRKKIQQSIQERCGTMRVLDMSQPIGLNDIYTNVNILEKITGRRRKEIVELLKDSSSEDLERFGLGRITDKRVPGLNTVEKYTNLIIFGKPGAGKTTFLKYVAIQCIEGNFQADRVPIFVTLKDFAEAPHKPNLLEYLTEQFSGYSDTNTFDATYFQKVINHGKTLVLLDGLDEVREKDSARVLKQIRYLSNVFRGNHFIITCRIAALEYTFEKFTEVEVADFDDQQISIFATNWFKNKAVKSESFLRRLRENNRIRQLATSPLLLTLLCLAFEESGAFPTNRSELYKEGLDTLLKRWDAKRGIERDQGYKNLCVQRKEDLLSKIAFNTFDQFDYFFTQKAAEQYITDYIRNLPDANTDKEALQLESEVVLHSIESQHGLLVQRAKGIYSFSHLTFHEYFTAREIISATRLLEKKLQDLVSHITDKRWGEIFFLSVEMLARADCLLQLMKNQVDALLANDEKLQQFLMWINQKSLVVQAPFKPAAVRSFYFDRNHSLAHILDPTFTHSHIFARDINLDYVLANILAHAHDPGCTYKLVDDFAHALAIDVEPELWEALQQLKAELPDPNDDEKILKQWWQSQGQIWLEKLRSVLIPHRNIGHDWKFTKQQKQALKDYLYVNNLLVNCLNSNCYVSREVRQEIEDTLLLPIAEIENRKRLSYID